MQIIEGKVIDERIPKTEIRVSEGKDLTNLLNILKKYNLIEG